jgi:hypothetical protein
MDDAGRSPEPMSMQYSHCVSVAAVGSARSLRRLSTRVNFKVACSSLPSAAGSPGECANISSGSAMRSARAP